MVPSNQIQRDEVTSVARALSQQNNNPRCVGDVFRKALAYNAIEVARHCYRTLGNGRELSSPILDVVTAGKYAFLEMLLEEGHNPNMQQQTWYAIVPLIHEAVGHGHTDLLHLLISYGAFVNIRDLDGNTALHVAAEHNYARMVEELLALGADPDTRNQKGAIPMKLAVKMDGEAAAEALQRSQEVALSGDRFERDAAPEADDIPRSAPGAF